MSAKETIAVGNLSHYSAVCTNRKYTGICIGAGGAKAALELGAINEFWSRNQLQNLYYYSGSSAGSMLALLMAVGYTPAEILAKLCSPDFARHFNTINFMNIPSIYGLYPNSILRNKIEEMVMVKLGYCPTFAQLRDRIGKYIIVPVYCLSETDESKRKIYCSPQNTPNMHVITAVVLSCTMPIMFQKATYDGNVYLDGAYVSSFPIKELQKVSPVNTPILGILLDNRNSADMNTFTGYSMEILLIAVKDQDNLSSVTDYTDVFEITTPPNLQSHNFNITTKDKMRLFSIGTNQIKKLFISIDALFPYDIEREPDEIWTDPTDIESDDDIPTPSKPVSEKKCE